MSPGAGFYVNATNPKWAKHYNMLTHVTIELPQVLEAAGLPLVRPPRLLYSSPQLRSTHLPLPAPPLISPPRRKRRPSLILARAQDLPRQSIFGHSMGGHGALTLYLGSILSGTKQYRSVSAFAPIANPTECPWGQKAFAGYLQGGVEEARERYDATELVKRLGKAPVHVLVDYVSLSAFSPGPGRARGGGGGGRYPTGVIELGPWGTCACPSPRACTSWADT